MATTKRRESQEELAQRGVLAHIEHLKSIGAALVKAADTYVAGHKASEKEGNWRDDFANNVSDASREFHRSLAASSQKVSDVYFGEADATTESQAKTS